MHVDKKKGLIIFRLKLIRKLYENIVPKIIL